MKYPIWSLVAIYLLVAADLSAQGFRTSRGGGIPPSRSFSPSTGYKTGSKSSSVNVHQKHARTTGQQGNPYKSFVPKPQVNHFAAEPTTRPVYIPPQVRRDKVAYPVVFHKDSYGYWHGPSFIPVGKEDYVASSAGPVLVRLVVLALFVFIAAFAIASALQAMGRRHARRRQVDEATRDIPDTLASEQPLLKKLYAVRPGKIITLSDPLTLSYYEKPLDLRVVETVSYRHATFSLFHVAMRNERDGQSIYLFVKDVAGDFCMFMGILDHEGRNGTLQAQEWFHLDKGEDRFAGEFAAIFPPVEGKPELRVTFAQFDFGAFYDVAGSKDAEKLIGISEYHPQGAPESFDWQHAIVTWEGGWISCYYCREIHSRNVDVF